MVGRGQERFETIGGVRFKIENVKAFREEYRDELAEKLRQKKIEEGKANEYGFDELPEKDKDGTDQDENTMTFLTKERGEGNPDALPNLDVMMRNELTMIQYATSHK
jgi:hypothetical protein